MSDNEIHQLLAIHPKTKLIVKTINERKAKERQADQFIRAAGLNNVTELQRLLLEEKVSPDQKNTRESTALIAAAIHGHEDIANLLLEYNANINLSGYEVCGMSTTPLISAAFHGNFKMTQFLIEAKASIELTAHSNNTALDLAIPDHYVHINTSCPQEYGYRALSTIQVLLEHNAQIHDSIKLLHFLNKCDKKNPGDLRIVNCLEYLCQQLEARGIEEPKDTSKWDRFVNTFFTPPPQNNADVLKSARKLLNEKTRKTTIDHSIVTQKGI